MQMKYKKRQDEKQIPRSVLLINTIEEGKLKQK